MTDEDQIKEKLKDIPHCFVLNDCLLGKSKDYIRQKIDLDDDEIYDEKNKFNLEVTRKRNFISYLFWITGEKDKALNKNEEVLKLERDNLVATANRILFCLENDNVHELNIMIAKLEDLKRRPDFEVCLLKAKAELAYNYSRLDPKQLERSRRMLHEVIDQLDNLNTEHKIDRNLIYICKYSVGHTAIKLSKHSYFAKQVSRCNQRTKEAIKAFLDVIHGQWDSKRLKAKAYAKLGGTFYRISNAELPIGDFFRPPYDTWDELIFYQTALELYKEETYILEGYGKFLRYRKMYKESENILRKSIDIRPTSNAHYYLALTLRSKFHKHLARQKYATDRSPTTTNRCSRQRLMPNEGSREKRTSHARKQFDDDYQASNESLQGMTFNRQQSKGQLGRSNEDHISMPFESGLKSSVEPTLPDIAKIKFSPQKCSGELWLGPNSPWSPRGNIRGQSSKLDRSPGDILSRDSTKRSVNLANENRDSTQCQTISSQSCWSSLEQSDQAVSGFRQVPFEIDGSVVKRPTATQFERNVSSDMEPEAIQPDTTARRDQQRREALAMIKSPKQQLILPADDDRTKEIIYHFDKALCIRKDNNGALYNKGRTLRAMQHFDEAIHAFKQLITKESSLTYLANAYEECALCYYDKIKNHEVEGDELRKVTCNMKDYLMKTVAISAKLVAAVPDISEVWVSASSLEEVLFSKESKIKPMAVLSNRLYNYRGAAGYYKDIINTETSKHKVLNHLVAIATKYMSDCNFIAAITILDLARTHHESKMCMDKNVYLRCLVEVSFQAIEQGHEKQLGCKYLTSGLKHALKCDSATNDFANEESSEQTDEDDVFDIYLLCAEGDRDVASKVLISLKDDCGLHVTMNSMDIFWGTPKLGERLALIERCSYFVIFVARQYSEEQLYQLSIENIVLNKNNITVILEDEFTKVPQIVERFPQLVYTVTADTNEARLDWLKRLMLTMLKVT